MLNIINFNFRERKIEVFCRRCPGIRTMRNHPRQLRDALQNPQSRQRQPLIH